MKVVFDPDKTSYFELASTFLKHHNPDFEVPFYRGGQYRTSILFASAEQEQEAKRAIKDYEQKVKRKLHTYLESAGQWWRAEEYHQKYYEKHRTKYCF